MGFIFSVERRLIFKNYLRFTDRDQTTGDKKYRLGYILYKVDGLLAALKKTKKHVCSVNTHYLKS